MYRDLVIFGAADAAVYWQVLGTGDHQRLVVQWSDVGFYGYYGADPVTFEAVLSEADGSVQFQITGLADQRLLLQRGPELQGRHPGLSPTAPTMISSCPPTTRRTSSSHRA